MPSGYPMGELGIQNFDTNTVDLFDTIYGDIGVFEPTAGDTLYKAGLALARNVADDKLTPYVAAQHGTDRTGEPIALLGADVLSDSGPADVPLRVIIGGRVKQEKLHTLLAPTVELSETDKDRLRNYGNITASLAPELNKLDNQ